MNANSNNDGNSRDAVRLRLRSSLRGAAPYVGIVGVSIYAITLAVFSSIGADVKEPANMAVMRVLCYAGPPWAATIPLVAWRQRRRLTASLVTVGVLLALWSVMLVGYRGVQADIAAVRAELERTQHQAAESSGAPAGSR